MDSGATSDSEMGSDSDSDSDAPITASNFAARSRALDARAAHDAQLDKEDFQMATQVNTDEFEGIEDMDEDEEEVDEPGEEGIVLPTAEERAEEKRAGGPEVHIVQKRMRECVRILKKWKVFGAKTSRFVICSISDTVLVMIRIDLDRVRSEFVEQLVAEIASYYGYNEFLAEKLFQLFPVTEVRASDLLAQYSLADDLSRLWSSSMLMRFPVRSLLGRIFFVPDVEIWRRR